MLGGRFFTNTLKPNGSASWKSLPIKQRPCLTYAFSSTTRALSILQTSPVFPFPKKGTVPLSNAQLLSKRFFQSGNNDNKTLYRSWTSKLMAAFGILLGIGSGGAYTAYQQLNGRDTILSNLDLVASCAAKEGGDGKCAQENECLRSILCKEELATNANKELENAIRGTRCKAAEHTEAAMKAYGEAVPLIIEYLNHGYCTLDNDDLIPPEYEESYCCLYNLAKARCDKVREAMEKGMCAWELLCRLRQIIDKGKVCEYTSCNPLLATSEEWLLCAERELLNMKAKMDWAQTDHEMADQYKAVIEAFRRELREKLEARKKDGMVDCCPVDYPEQEMAIIIKDAYALVLRKQKEMAQSLVCQGRVPYRYCNTCC